MSSTQLSFDYMHDHREDVASGLTLEQELPRFREFGKETVAHKIAYSTDNGTASAAMAYVNEYWTSKQRAAHSLHEISYRACFKPQLPRFFIQRLTEPGDVVYDPFMGRGTTPLEAALMGRVPKGCDVNPLSRVITEPRLEPPEMDDVVSRLSSVDLGSYESYPEELLVFYHPETLKEICALKDYFLDREYRGTLDSVDRWLRVVAINRLTGHSPGFFSVYTLPPNQATGIKSQAKINAKREQIPPRRHVRDLIIKKSRSLLSKCDDVTRANLSQVVGESLFLTQSSTATPEIASNSVSLVVTSPPFLDVVDYAGDNWLRCWFCDIDPDSIEITQARKLEDWKLAMTRTFFELERILVPGGHVAFEVGEVRGGKIKLEETVLPCGVAAGLEPILVLINDQNFTKTSHCWGIDNSQKGTNTNRVVVFKKN